MDNLEKRLLEIYYDRVVSDYPQAIESLDFVNSIIRYMYDLYYDFHIKELVKNDQKILTTEEIYDVCIEILKSINPKYSRFFKKCLYDDKIEYVEDDASWTDKDGLHITTHKISIDNIEEILMLLHEFGHYRHLIKSGKEDLCEADAWHISETIAMTFEFYAFFYMYENKILVPEVKKSFLRYIKFIYNRLNDIMAEALMFDIMNKYGDLGIANILEYAKEYRINNEQLSTITKYEYNKLVRYLSGDDNDLIIEKRYYEGYRYIYGLPLAIYMANRMVRSDSYKERFVENLDNIKHMDSNTFLKHMGAYRIIKDPECLEWVLGHVKSYTNHIITDGTINTKMIRFKR